MYNISTAGILYKKKKKIPIKIGHEIIIKVKRFFGNNLDSRIQNIIIQLILLHNVVIL